MSKELKMDAKRVEAAKRIANILEECNELLVFDVIKEYDTFNQQDQFVLHVQTDELSTTHKEDTKEAMIEFLMAVKEYTTFEDEVIRLLKVIQSGDIDYDIGL